MKKATEPSKQSKEKASPKKAQSSKSATSAAAPAKPVKSSKAKTQASGAEKKTAAGITRQHMKSKPVCKVTFQLPKDAAPKAGSVMIVGDFNNWETGATPMKKLKDGCYAATVSLETGKEYHYRFLIDGQRWENDWFADRYEPNPYGGDNSVVVV
jgi:1,4-alpha-glucan branching enzyme